MKKYKVIWEEKHQAIVKAESARKARAKVMNGEVEGVPVELSSQPEAYLEKE